MTGKQIGRVVGAVGADEAVIGISEIEETGTPETETAETTETETTGTERISETGIIETTRESVVEVGAAFVVGVVDVMSAKLIGSDLFVPAFLCKAEVVHVVGVVPVATETGRDLLQSPPVKRTSGRGVQGLLRVEPTHRWRHLQPTIRRARRISRRRNPARILMIYWGMKMTTSIGRNRRKTPRKKKPRNLK